MKISTVSALPASTIQPFFCPPILDFNLTANNKEITYLNINRFNSSTTNCWLDDQRAEKSQFKFQSFPFYFCRYYKRRWGNVSRQESFSLLFCSLSPDHLFRTCLDLNRGTRSARIHGRRSFCSCLSLFLSVFCFCNSWYAVVDPRNDS